MTDTLRETSYEDGTRDEKLQTSPVASEGKTSTVCEYPVYASIGVLLTLEEWILAIGIKALQAFIVKSLPLTGASREDREDLAQEVLSRLHFAYGRDRRTPANWWGLLKPTIRYAAYDFLRYQLRRVKTSAGIEVEAMECKNCATVHGPRNELVEALLDLQREGCAVTDEGIEMLVLKLCDKAKLAEIARALGYRVPSGVHPKLHAAIDSLFAFRTAAASVSPSPERFGQHAATG